jgi:hypothetical protein
MWTQSWRFGRNRGILTQSSIGTAIQNLRLCAAR